MRLLLPVPRVNVAARSAPNIWLFRTWPMSPAPRLRTAPIWRTEPWAVNPSILSAPMTKSVMRSKPLSRESPRPMTKTSLPVPPVRMSGPPRPLRTSSPPPPLSPLAPLLPVMTSAFSEPFTSVKFLTTSWALPTKGRLLIVRLSLERSTARDAVVPAVPSMVLVAPRAPTTASTEKSATVSTDPSAFTTVPPRTRVMPVLEAS